MTSRCIWRSALLISFALGCGSSRSYIDQFPASGPQLIIENADVITPQGHFDAVAIKGSTIAGFGKDALRHRAQARRVIDAKGGTVIIGLTDAHCHLYGLGVDMENVSVRQLDSEAAVVAVVANAAKQRPATEWLVGRGWDQNRWPGQQFPTKASLDAQVSDRPVLLRRIDGHAIWVNSRALAEAGITKATPDPAGGKIVRDAAGEPTGVFIDNATDLVDTKMPPASAEARERRIPDKRELIELS